MVGQVIIISDSGAVVAKSATLRTASTIGGMLGDKKEPVAVKKEVAAEHVFARGFLGDRKDCEGVFVMGNMTYSFKGYIKHNHDGKIVVTLAGELGSDVKAVMEKLKTYIN